MSHSAGKDPMAFIVVERDEGVVQIRLDRPASLNSQIPALWHELRGVADSLLTDDTVQCMVLSGSGTSFSSGLDRRALANGELTPAAFTGNAADEGRVTFEQGDIEVAQQAFRWLSDAPFVTIAAVQGYCLGAGAELALACDIRLLAHDAVLALPETELGMMPDMGGCDGLARIVGYSRALELALTCRRVNADEAMRLGLASSVVPTDELHASVLALAQTIASRKPSAVRFVKKAIRAAARGDSDGSFALAREGAARLSSEATSALAP